MFFIEKISLNDLYLLKTNVNMFNTLMGRNVEVSLFFVNLCYYPKQSTTDKHKRNVNYKYSYKYKSLILLPGNDV